MSERDYLFARRFPVGHPRNALAPVGPKAWWIVGTFVIGMLLGGILFALFSMNGQVVLGAAVFGIFALVSGVGFIVVASRYGDHEHTVDDYREGRVTPPDQP